MSELVDVVDEHDHVTDVVTRAEMRARNLRHRAVYLAVISTDGRLLIHQRAPHKDVWPSYWDVAAGGVVASGETYDDAARRELREELGIDADIVAVDNVACAYDDGAVRVMGRVYVVHSEGPFHFEDGEVVAARFVGSTELHRLLETEPWCPDSVALVVPRVRPLIGA